MSRFRLHAPKQNQQILLTPGWEKIDAILNDNRQQFQEANFCVGGSSFQDFRRKLRLEITQSIVSYFEQSGEQIPPILQEMLTCQSSKTALADRPWIVSGHQPELYHPGVWVKHFALNQIGREHQLIPLHLIVDTDTIKSTSIRVPVFHSQEEVELKSIPFDEYSGEIPYEFRRVQSPDLWDHFYRKVQDLTRNWPEKPMIEKVWPTIQRQYQNCQNIGESFSRARRDMERSWGCFNLEIPMSWVSQCSSFREFVAWFLDDLPEWHRVHNQILCQYRKENRIRSSRHPFPDLAVEKDSARSVATRAVKDASTDFSLSNDDEGQEDNLWYEAPFWAYVREDKNHAERESANGESASSSQMAFGQRNRLWVKRTRNGKEYRAGNKIFTELPEVRTKAFTTTLFARFFLGDLFIHGLGGGIYDEVTDRIMKARLAGIVPHYLINTATIHLESSDHNGPPVSHQDWVDKKQDLRRTYWNPQQYVPADDLVRLAKEELIRQQPTEKKGRKDRYRKLLEYTMQMREPLFPQYQEKQQQLLLLKKYLDARAKATRRDFCCWLFSESSLKEFYSLSSLRRSQES